MTRKGFGRIKSYGVSAATVERLAEQIERDHPALDAERKHAALQAAVLLRAYRSAPAAVRAELDRLLAQQP